MKFFKPDYYDEFHCIKDKCQHTCCKNWIISIDNKTLKKYKLDTGVLADKLKTAVDYKKKQFILREDKYCPFLTSNGLCDIILKYGEDALSEICTVHPRYNNFLSDRTETGLGMCCEEVARIIVSLDKLSHLELYDEDKKKANIKKEEKEILSLRDKVFSIIYTENSYNDIKSTIYKDFMLKKIDYNMGIDALLGCERLENDLFNHIKELKANNILNVDMNNLSFINILIYFITRHTAYSIDNLDFKARLQFAFFSTEIISAITSKIVEKGVDFKKTLIDVCRMYSSEIEYSDDNFYKMLDALESSCL